MLSISVLSVTAQDVSYKGLYYTAPPRWTSGMQDGQFILAPADMTEETAVVVVLSGAESLGGKPFQDWLKARMSSGMNAQVKVLQSTPIESSTSGSLQVLSTARTIKDASGGVRLQMYYAISDGKQAATAMLLTSSETGMKKYMPAFQSLFSSMRFTAASPAPPPAGAPSAPGGFVDGIQDTPPAPAKPGAAGNPAPQTKPAPGGAARTFQNVIYTVPPGWSAQENAGGVALSPQVGLQRYETLSLLILPGKVATSLEQEFQTTWMEVCAMLNAQSMRNVSGSMYDLEGAAQSSSGWDFLRGTGGAMNDQQRFTISLFLAKVNERIERVAVIAREIELNYSTTNASLNPRFHGAIEEFLFGLRFANWQTPNFPEAKLTGGAITGVWQGISMAGGELKTGAAVFFSDGSAWFGSNFPTYGLAGVKPHIESNSVRRRWGTYKFQGGSGVLTMIFGAIPLRLDGNALVMTTNNTPHRYVRSYPAAASHLNGRYCLTTGAGCLTLTSSGQFSDEGAVRVVEHSVYPYPLSPESGQGEYEIRDYTLILRYAGGPEVHVAFPGFMDQASAASTSPAAITLSFNEDELKRM